MALGPPIRHDKSSIHRRKKERISLATSGAKPPVSTRLVPGAALWAGPGPMLHTGGFPMPRKGALDSDRAHATFGYSPRFDLEQGLAAYVSSYRASHR